MTFRESLRGRIAAFELKMTLLGLEPDSPEWITLAHARKEWSHNQAMCDAQCDIDLTRLGVMLASRNGDPQ